MFKLASRSGVSHAGAAAAIPVTGGLALAIRLRFHNHAPQQLPTCLTLE